MAVCGISLDRFVLGVERERERERKEKNVGTKFARIFCNIFFLFENLSLGIREFFYIYIYIYTSIYIYIYIYKKRERKLRENNENYTVDRVVNLSHLLRLFTEKNETMNFAP